MTHGSQAPPQRYHALLALLRNAESVWSASRVFFAQWDLSPSQFNILNLLYASPSGLSQSVLGRELATHRSNVTGLVDRLEQRGLVSRRESASDRRAWRVVLTPHGQELLDRVLPHYYEVAEEVWGLTPSARAQAMVEEFKHLADRAGRLAAKIGTKPE